MPAMDRQDPAAVLEHLTAQLDQLDNRLMQEEILLHALLRSYPDEDAPADSPGRTAAERAKAEARERADALQKERQDVQGRAIAIRAHLPVNVTPLKPLRLTGKAA